MWLLVAGAALAGLRADLERAGSGTPDVSVACTSAATAGLQIQRVLAALGAGGSAVPDLAGFFERGENAEIIGESTRVVLSYWKAAEAVRIGFDSLLPVERAAHGFAAMAGEGRPEALQGPAGWILRDGGGIDARVSVEDGWAYVTKGTPPADAARLLPRALQAVLPETPGCSVMVLRGGEGALAKVDVVVHLPFASEEGATFAVALPEGVALDGIVFSPGVPVEVRTQRVPEGVAVLGIGLDGVDFSGFLEGGELRRVRKVQRWFPVTSGTTVALWDGQPLPTIGAMIPLGRELGARKVARRAARLLKRNKVVVTRSDATHFSAEMGVLRLYFAGLDGRLLVATDAGTLVAMQSATGPAWVTPALAGLTARYPLVLSSSILPGSGGTPTRRLPAAVSLALALEPGMVRGTLTLPISIEELAEIRAEMKRGRDEPGPDEPGPDEPGRE